MNCRTQLQKKFREKRNKNSLWIAISKIEVTNTTLWQLPNCYFHKITGWYLQIFVLCSCVIFASVNRGCGGKSVSLFLSLWCAEKWRCNIVLISIRLRHIEWRVIFWYWFKCKQIKCLYTWMGLKSVLLLGWFKSSIIVYCNHSHNGRKFFNSKSRRINNVVLARARCVYQIHVRICSRTHAREYFHRPIPLQFGFRLVCVECGHHLFDT